MEVAVAGVAPAAAPRGRGGAPISSVSSIASASRSSGTTMSSLTLPPRCAVTANDDAVAPAPERRDLVGRATGAATASASSPSASQQLALQARRLGRVPSASASTRKPAPSGTPPGTTRAGASSVAAVEVLERRRPRGRCRARRAIAAQPARRCRVEARHGSAASGAGISRSQAAVIDRRACPPSRSAGSSGRSRRRPCGSGRRRGRARRAATTASRPVTQCAGDAVLEGVRAAGVRRDVAADLRLLGGARDRAGRAGRSRARAGGRRPSCTPASTGSARAAGRTSARASSRSSASTTPPDRHRAAGVAGAAAARHDRHVVLVAPGDDRRDLLRARRQHDRVGAPAQAARLGRVGQVGRGGAVQHRGDGRELLLEVPRGQL